VKTGLKVQIFDDIMDENKLGSFLFMHPVYAVCVCVRACVRPCVHACVRACVRVTHR